MAEGNKDDVNADLKARLRAAEKRVKDLEGENAQLKGRTMALEQELRPFHVLADNIPDHIYFKDKEGRFLWVNRNLYNLHGVQSREELIGKSAMDITIPSGRSPVSTTICA